MNKILAALVTSTAIGAAGIAWASNPSASSEANVKYDKDGGYESTRSDKSTTSGGTKHKSESSVDVDVDAKGEVEKTIKTEASTDPKGLMNKKDDTSETKIKEKTNGGYEQTTTRKHKDADGTNTTYKTVTDVTIDNNGNVTTTAETKKTVDPEGLLNEKTTTSKTKMINGEVVENSKKIN